MTMDTDIDLDPKWALWYCGQDDKASIPVGRKIPIAASTHQMTRAIVDINSTPLAADHDWKSG